MQRTTSFSYDAVGRLTKVVDATGNAAEQYAYSANGKQASFTDARGNATTYIYDGFDRLTRTTFPIGTTGFHTTEAFTYDANDNMLTRLTRAGQTISFAYDTLNRRCSKTVNTSPTACTATSSASPTVWYGYDLNGRATSMIDNSAAITAAVLPVPGTPVSYATTTSYDRLNRPVNVSFSPALASTAPAAGSVTFAHAYNGANQRSGQTETDNSWLNYPAPASPVSYTANALNQYTAVGAVTPSYDANGNLTFDGTFTFGYDAENRLTSASGAGNTASYTYNAQGRRKTKTVNGATTVYVTDADNREVMQYDGASGAISRWFAYGLGSNDVLSLMNVAAATRTTFIPDIQGSIIASIDSASGAVSKVGYLPYGKSVGAGPFGFTAQRIDPETNGLYYYRARHYSPAWGRFMQADPIGLAGGKNLYAYVGNDPLNYLDPFGQYGILLSYGLTAVAGTGNTPAATVTNTESGSTYQVNGAFATLQAGGGVFLNGSSASAGGIITAQAAVTGLTPSGDTTVVSALRSPSGGDNGVLGASVGTGRGLTFTTARDVSDLSGTSHVTQIDLGLISFQYSTGTANDGTAVRSYSVGGTFGFGVSSYDTQSYTAGTGRSGK
jgi:RHS repeat-associated protein